MAQVRPLHRRPTLITRLTAALALAALAPAAAAEAAIPPAPTPEFYGVTTATDLEPAEFARMDGAGVRTLRVAVYWPFIEPRPLTDPIAPGVPEDNNRFHTLDRIVERAAMHGVRVMPFVYGTPPWVAEDPERPPIDDAAGRAAWQDFLGDLVTRYGPGGEFWRQRAPLDPSPPELPITAWQIWNEPNSIVFWSPRPSAAEYATVVRLASEAIKAVDPIATVVLGGMFGDPTQGTPAAEFLTHLYRSPGVAEHFDAFAIHPYAPSLPGVAAQVRRLRAAATAAGDIGLPLWITEIGWPTRGPASFNLVKSEQGQKRLLARSYRLFLARRERWLLDRVIWYVWRDNEVQEDCYVCRYSGLFDEQLQPKPAWHKLTQFTGGSP